MKDRNKEVLSQELGWAYVGLFVCLVFTSFGVGLIISGVRGGAFNHVSSTIFVCIFIFGLFGFSIFCFIQCLKRLIPYYQSLKALKLGT